MAPMPEDNPYRAPRPEPEQPRESWAPPAVDMTQAIRVSGPYTWKHCFAAAKLVSRWRDWWRFALIVAATITGLKIAYSLVVRGQPWEWRHAFEAMLVLILAPLVPLVILYPARIVMAVLLWRVWRTARLHNWVTADAVRTDCPGCSMTFAWDYFDRGHVSGEVVVLRTGERQYGILILPRSHFPSDEDWGTFVSWVQSKVPRH